MAASTLLARFSSSRQRNVVSLVVSVSQVVIGYQNNGVAQVDAQSVTDTAPWSAALQLLNRHEITKSDIHLVLGHGLYQTLLIDDPKLSQEDIRAALPFKLKDFLSDSPSDIVADGFSSPIANRFQAFVCHKQPLLQFNAALEKRQCKLTAVSPEDVVLRQWTQLDKAEMVLTRDGQGVLQIAVFDQGKLCFQRQVRGMMIEGDQLPPLVIDDLALEIQRSLDYLRSQLKHANVSGLVVGVQGVDDTELAFQLSSRLSVSVRPQTLFETGEHQQHIALASLNRDCSPDINLFSDDLSPSRAFLTFEKMLLIWGLTGLLIVLVAAYQQWQVSQSNKALETATQSRSVAESASNHLNDQLALHVPSLNMLNDVSRAEAAITSRQKALEAVAVHDAALQQGYASVFRALSDLSRRDISVSEIAIGRDTLDIKGLAATPSSVPAWLQSFQTQKPLSGRVFEKMALTRDENERLAFSLNAKREKGEAEK
ncbi:MSHA biogenesis protein MshI [Enterovibrio sp. ZSDZ42]|uniref:MSHA biogenesis protein MshI n=1 Tax=Enterovibrio gelatinilyticus TaxID=2899819 RepID=A0ABT5QVN4_9GAMM|nr:MSHA biogenesis protein MshI [Enterovibrio sp. ZSDZ42]MDD1792063.1 MSHA biogenesis protein MshI [Enterovibrio sp. ZSDZ42]